MNQLERAIYLAVIAHTGQLDKVGQPYILHPLRVMLSVSTESERVVAILHDVVEDTPWTCEDLLASGFSKYQVEAVRAITKVKGQKYEDYIRQVKVNPLALSVKMADISDNMSPRRLYNLAPEKAEYLKDKYTKALELINKPS